MPDFFGCARFITEIFLALLDHRLPVSTSLMQNFKEWKALFHGIVHFDILFFDQLDQTAFGGGLVAYANIRIAKS